MGTTGSSSGNGPARVATRPALASRALGVPTSVLHGVHHEVETQERERGTRIFKLHVGEPGFRPPESVLEAIASATRDGKTAYTTAEGLLPLRELIAERMSARHGLPVSADRVVVTPGSTQALLAVMLATCDPGDELLLPEVHWPLYAQAAAVAGIRVGYYSLGPGAALEAERVAARVTPSTRLVVLNSPSNPTGAVASRTEVRSLVAHAHERDLLLISDEAYECFVYSGTHVAAAAEEHAMGCGQSRVFTVNTFSKSHAMTGLRLGYVIAPNAAAARTITRIQEGSIVAPSTPVQWAGIAALKDTTFVERARTYLFEQRDRVLGGIRDLLVPLPQAGWYALVSIARTGLSGEDFARTLLAERQVAVAPGSAFVPVGSPDPKTVRLAFCGEADIAAEGVARLGRFIAMLSRRGEDAPSPPALRPGKEDGVCT